MDLHVEDPAGEVNVACEAQPPRSEKHRARVSIGGAASGLSDQSDTTRAGVQEMASPAPAADDSLPFGKPPRCGLGCHSACIVWAAPDGSA